MISVHEAERRILGEGWDLGESTVSLQDILGRVLSEDLVADRDGPPFDRVAMDGIAIRDSDVASTRFHIVGFQAAGQPPMACVEAGTAIEVATGAMLPIGCTTVIPYEHISKEDGTAFLAPERRVKGHQNVHRQGGDFRQGTLLLPTGTRIGAPHVHLLATCGAVAPRVKRRCQWALVGTGDELVPPDKTPLPFQIRQSNIQAIQAEAVSWRIPAESMTTLQDDVEAQVRILGDLLDHHDAIVVTGGVSRGLKDSIPEVMQRLGVEEVFHKVSQKPGKPMWFGLSREGNRVFGLPGNPVSSLVTFRRYVLPALLAPEGISLPSQMATLEGWQPQSSDLTHFVLGHVAQGRFLPTQKGGSGDLRPLACSSGFAEVAPGTGTENRVPFFPWGIGGGQP